MPKYLLELNIQQKEKYRTVNIYFQDESRFGLKTDIGKCLTAKGVKPIVKYQHAFKNTYLYGSYSPINGNSFTYEIEGVSSEIFYNYLLAFSKYKPSELKIIFIDNASFHSLKYFNLPDNIKLINIPPYSPELNPCEKIWAYIKQHYKNKIFKSIDNLKDSLHSFIKNNLNEDIIMSITHNSFYIKMFNDLFIV